jgi:hypothetical protein
MGTTIIKGESHLLALAVANRGIRASKTAEVNQRQTQARANVLIVGAANGGHRRINFESKDIIKRKCHPTTVVTFSPTGLKTMFEQVMGTFQKGRWGASPEEKGVQEEWAKSADSLLKKKMYSWPDKPFRKNAKRGGAKGRDQKFRKSSILDGAKFWALPYVGINDNIYRGKGHMQQE